MKNKILLTAAMALIGLFTLSTTAEAQRGRGGRGQLNISINQCGNGWGFNNNINNRMCLHMRSIWRGGRNVRGIVRCNHRGCGMFGSSFRNGRFYNIPNGRGNINRRGRGNINRRGHGNNRRYNQGGGRGNGRLNQGGGRGNGRGNGGGNGRGNGRNNGRGRG